MRLVEGIHVDCRPNVAVPRDLPEQVSPSAASALLWILTGRECVLMEGGTRQCEDGRWRGSLAYREKDSGLGYALEYAYTPGDAFATIDQATLAPAPCWDRAREGREVDLDDVLAIWPDDIEEWLGLGKGVIDSLEPKARMAAHELFERLGTPRYVGYGNDQSARMVAECRPLVFDGEGNPRIAMSRDAAMHRDMAGTHDKRGRRA